MVYTHVVNAIEELRTFCLGNDCYTCILCDRGECIINNLIHRLNVGRENEASIHNTEILNKPISFRMDREKY